MSESLQQRISREISKTLTKPGEWMVWCDPRNDWGPLLQMAANAPGMKGFTLYSLTTEDCTWGKPGGLVWRTKLKELTSVQQSFVLHVVASPQELGWLWVQALRAETIYRTPLRDALQEWGWRAQSSKTGNDELARMAKNRTYFQQDPADWGGGGLTPNPMLLLELLAGTALRSEDDRMILDYTIESAGLPELPVFSEAAHLPALEKQKEEQKLELWCINALARLLTTHAHKIAPTQFAYHEYLLASDKRAFALELLEKWVDSVRLSKDLALRILQADRMATLGQSLQRETLETVGRQEAFLSHAAERALFAQTCTNLAGRSGRDLLETLAALQNELAIHAKGFWGDTLDSQRFTREGSDLESQIIPWGELARLSRAADQLLNAIPQATWSRPEEILEWYVQAGWRVDQSGEEVMRHLSRATAELIDLINPLRFAYLSHWEPYLLQWTDIWQQAGCPRPALASQGEWLMKQLADKRPLAVLVVDAMRYDIAMALLETINENEGAERAQISPARTALPTVTALGMGMALPVRENDLRAEIDHGKWQLYHKKQPALNLSIAENRREWLRTEGKVAPEALLNIKDVENGKIPEPQDGRTRLFVFDSVIDKLGHDEELELMGTRDVQQRYLRAIKHLREKRWERIVLVTDHGFIHWPGANEQRVSPPLPDPAYTSRRALAYASDLHLDGPKGSAPGKKWQIAVASGASCFRTYGGLGFFHGGASLQEWIVPCLKIEWPGKAKYVKITIQRIDQILSLRPKIVLDIVREHSVEQALARQIEVRIREQERNLVLFRSKPVMATPDPERDTLTVLMELAEIPAESEFGRNTSLKIEVRDLSSEVVIAEATTTLMVEIKNDW
jgi:broad specificity phosphatase PhoE